MSRQGDWMQTRSGQKFWPLDPRPDEVVLEDIAHALSNTCRFAGHCRTFYSVAEHSVRASLLMQRSDMVNVGTMSLGRRIAFWGAWHGVLGGLWLWHRLTRSDLWSRGLALATHLHDATEAYVTDVPRPLKSALVGYQEIESRVARAIEAHFNIADHGIDDVDVKHFDEVLLATEARDLMGGHSEHKWSLRAAPFQKRIRPWSSAKARAMFLARFVELDRCWFGRTWPWEGSRARLRRAEEG